MWICNLSRISLLSGYVKFKLGIFYILLYMLLPPTSRHIFDFTIRHVYITFSFLLGACIDTAQHCHTIVVCSSSPVTKKMGEEGKILELCLLSYELVATISLGITRFLHLL